MKKIAIIGSTGSIGRQTLEVVDVIKDEVEVYALSAHSNVELLIEQVYRYQPKVVTISDEAKFPLLSEGLADWSGKILGGEEGLVEVASDPQVDLVVSAAVGVAGLAPTYAAVKAGKRVALANKETLVAAGKLIMTEVSKNNAPLLPIDSEHSAIFQSLMGENVSEINKILLTASGGPFREKSVMEMKKATLQDALAHPTWRMGGKITIDSATLMNKGLEVLEAHWLFGLELERIEVVIHPQSVVHSLIEMVDGSVLAQLGPADMRLPIQFALTHPKRKSNNFSRLDLTSIGSMEFFKPDYQRFPCLKLAFEAGKIGGSMTAVMNAANEEAVRYFLEQRIGFLDIPRIVEMVMGEHHKGGINYDPDLGSIIAFDEWARIISHECMKKNLK